MPEPGADYHPRGGENVSSSDMSEHLDQVLPITDRALDGLTITWTGTTLHVATGHANIQGKFVSIDSQVDEALSEGDNYVFLNKTADIRIAASSTPNADEILLHFVEVTGGVVTDNTSFLDSSIIFEDNVEATGSVTSGGNFIGSNTDLSAVQPYLELIDESAGGESWRIWNRNGKLQLTDPSGATVYIDDISHLAQSFQQSVKDVLDFTASEPASPTTGDRYINTGTGASSVTAQSLTANDIVEWNGVDWDEFTPVEGWITYVDDVNELYKFDGSTWTTLIPDGAGSGLDADLLDGQEGSYYTDRTNHTGDFETFSEIAEPASPAANNLKVYAADDGSGETKLYTKDSAGTVTELGSGGLTVVHVTAATKQMVSGESYYVSNASQVDLTLPTSPELDDEVEVVGEDGGIGWRISQNALNQIIISEGGAGIGRTTAGVSGFAESTDAFDALRLRCVDEVNGIWQPVYYIGVLNLA